MQQRRLGQSGPDVSPVGLGTWPMGGARYGQRDDTSAERTISAALDAGITCFDTAPSYGNGHAETVLGTALTGRRDDVVLVTKGGLVWNERSEVLGEDGSLIHLETVLDQSLRRLRTDAVDLFLIHWPDTTMEPARTAEALRALVDGGKTRYVGVSNYTGSAFTALAAELGDVPLVANQVSFHLFDRRWERTSFEPCRRLGAGIMAYGSLAHGLLTGSVTRSTRFDARDWRASGLIFGQPLLTDENRDHNLAVVYQLAEVASSAGMTLPQLALNWVLVHDEVSVSLVGARTPTEIEELARTTSEPLDETRLHEIDEVMTSAAGMQSTLPA
jgi:aryl-alcohol dehydrogenase-like predicted oxidoreductase